LLDDHRDEWTHVTFLVDEKPGVRVEKIVGLGWSPILATGSFRSDRSVPATDHECRELQALSRSAIPDAIRRAQAMIVIIGLTPSELGRIDASAM